MANCAYGCANLRIMRLREAPLLEQVPLFGPASIAVREFRPSAFRYPWHQHPEVELTWILKGSGLRYVGDSVEPFHAGDFCLLGRNLPHTWLSAERGTGPAQSLVIQFDPSRWGAPFMELPEMAKISDLLERASRGLSFGAAVAHRTREKMLRQKSPLGRLSALLDILEELSEYSAARPLAFAPWDRHRRMNSDPRVHAVLAFLSKNAGNLVTQKDAARLVRLSPAAFSRFFRRAFGKSFSAYHTDLRLSDACRRLLESNHSISEVAFAAGFHNLSTFNRSFRKARGISPRDFRNRALAV